MSSLEAIKLSPDDPPHEQNSSSVEMPRRVVLLHGFASDRESWVATAPALFALGQVWAIDCPGHGQSRQLKPASSLAQIAQQLWPAISGSHSEPLHLIGHSMGGALGLLLAGRYPEQIASLSMIAPLGLGAGLNHEFVDGFARLQTVDEVHTQLLLLVNNPRLISRQLASMVLQQLQSGAGREHLHCCAQAIADSQEALDQAIASVVQADVNRLILWGKEDRINLSPVSPVKDFGGQWHILDDCGHLPHIEKRTVVNKLLANFVDSSITA